MSTETWLSPGGQWVKLAQRFRPPWPSAGVQRKMCAASFSKVMTSSPGKSARTAFTASSSDDSKSLRHHPKDHKSLRRRIEARAGQDGGE